MDTTSNFRNRYVPSLVILLLIITIYFAVAIAFGVLDRPYWGDENHFVKTANLFSEKFGVEILADYPEVTTPLVYVLHSLWGFIFGTQLACMRIFNILLSFFGFLLLHTVVFRMTRDSFIALLTVCFFMANPYVIGTSVFVFTDMPAFLFLMLTLLAVYEQRPVLLAFAMAATILCRQYYVFFSLAILGYFFWDAIIGRHKKNALKMGIACAVGLIPFGVLVLLWGGLAPPMGKGLWTGGGGTIYHFGYLTNYIVFLTIYAFPFVAVAVYRKITPKLAIASLLVSPFYFFFPVATSQITYEQIGLLTAGFVHRFIKYAFPNPVVEHSIFFIFFFVGLMFLAVIVEKCYQIIKNSSVDFYLLLNLTIFSFLLVMPFSYQVWEKYCFPLVPFLALTTYKILQPSTAS